MQTDNAAGFKLSPQQRLGRRLASQSDTRSCVRGTASINGPVDAARLRECIQAVGRRHEILRTRFTDRAGVPLQIVTRDVEFSWSHRKDASSTAEIQLGDGQVFAAQLDSESPQQHRLTLQIATACADSLSVELLFREIAERYMHVEPEGLPMQYADIATWLNEMIASAGEGAEFWRKTLEGVADEARLPAEKSAPGARWPEFKAAKRTIADGAALARSLARRMNVDTSAALLGCWEALLARLTGTRRVVVGVTLPGRSYPGIDMAIGPLERQVPLIHDFDEGESVATLLSGVQSRITELACWQEYFSWEEGQRWGLGGARFGFAHHELASAWTAGELRWQVESLDCIAQPNSAMLWCTSSEHGLTCELNYDASRFSDEAVRNVLRQFEAVLRDMARVPESTTLSSLNLVDDEERAILASFNNTAWPNRQCSVLSLFEDQVVRRPGNVALSCASEELTYAELDARANRLAHHLRAAGVGPEDIVGVCLDRGISLIATLLAIWKAGAAYLPLQGLPRARMRHLWDDSGARLVVTDSVHAAELQSAGLRIIDVAAPEIAAHPATKPVCNAADAQLAYVMYTSGSTGQPKGVLVEQQSLTNYVLWVLRTYGLGESERTLMKTSISFDASVREWLMPLLQGGTLIILPEGLHRDPQLLIRELRDKRATTLHVVPTLLRVLLDEPTFLQCPHLVRVFVGGELVDPALVRRFQERTGKVLINMYGPTETTISATSFVMGPDDERVIGRPVANTHVRILRADLLPAAIGEVGEICIAGAAVARGYVGRPRDTAEKYLPDQNGEPGSRLYRTGDRGCYRADGVVQFLGRNDAQVKIRGYRVELTEIERTLQAQRGVMHAAVLVKERAPGDRQLVAYVEPSPTGPQPSVAQLSAAMRERLPDYMCPAQYVQLVAFPRTHSGKLDRVALAQLEVPASDERIAPRNDVEAQLAGIWSAVLRVPNVGVTDNFFEIGGDSIIAIQIVARARRAGLGITPLQMFQHQTVEELAKAVQPAAARTEDGRVTAPGPFPLTPIQAAFFEQPTDNVHHFNQGMVLEIPAHVQLPLLEKALITACEHHDSLQLRFVRTSTGWQQSYAAAQPEISRVDLSAADDPESKLRERVADAGAALNIIDGPLVRMLLVDLGRQRGRRLAVVAHHLVIDGVSWRILLEDVGECYTQLARGEQAHLPARTASYRRWSEGLREHVRTHDLQQELAYWHVVEEQRVDVLHADNPAGENLAAHERAYVVRLDESETRRLLSDAAKPYKTQVMELFLSALSAALYRWHGHNSVRLVLEGHGREGILPDVDLTRTVGWFTSMYPVVLEHRTDESIAERIKRVKEQMRAIPRKGVGYGLLRYLQPDSGLGGDTSLLVNYLGRLDGAIGRDALLPAATDGGADSVSPGRHRGHELALNALILDGCLQMCWTFSTERHREASIAELAQQFAQSLREVIEHCCSPQAGGFTLSDVTDFGWGTSQLDALASAISRVEDAHAAR